MIDKSLTFIFISMMSVYTQEVVEMFYACDLLLSDATMIVIFCNSTCLCIVIYYYIICHVLLQSVFWINNCFQQLYDYVQSAVKRQLNIVIVTAGHE